MAKESCLQVLAYFALMKPTIPSMKYVGFILPMQRDIAIYDLGNWDLTSYLEVLSAAAEKLEINRIPQTIPDGAIIIETNKDGELVLTTLGDVAQFNLDALFTQVTNKELPEILMELMGKQHLQTPKFKIGAHISKGKDISTALRNFITKYPEQPCQMFLRNPRT